MEVTLDGSAASKAGAPCRKAETDSDVFGLSQDGMLERLGLTDEFFRSRISAYELGNREPPLPVLLKYARLVGISTDVLIDDELDLPADRK